jgi:hypothetical protein
MGLFRLVPYLSLVLIPAARNSRRFCSAARRRASSSCFSRAFLFAFLPYKIMQPMEYTN